MASAPARFQESRRGESASNVCSALQHRNTLNIRAQWAMKELWSSPKPVSSPACSSLSAEKHNFCENPNIRTVPHPLRKWLSWKSQETCFPGWKSLFSTWASILRPEASTGHWWRGCRKNASSAHPNRTNGNRHASPTIWDTYKHQPAMALEYSPLWYPVARKWQSCIRPV